jgi:hypothetical protein
MSPHTCIDVCVPVVMLLFVTILLCNICNNNNNNNNNAHFTGNCYPIILLRCLKCSSCEQLRHKTHFSHVTDTLRRPRPNQVVEPMMMMMMMVITRHISEQLLRHIQQPWNFNVRKSETVYREIIKPT